MRKLYYICILLLFLAACKKDNNGPATEFETYDAKGTLTGIDPTMCACCGGLFLTVDNDPQIYRVHTLAGMTWQQMMDLQFPRRIKFNYSNTPASTCGIGKIIFIDDYILP